MNAIHSFAAAALARHWMPRHKVAASVWIKENLKIERRQSAEYGGLPVDIDRTPHARIIDDFLADPVAEELNIMKSSAAAMSSRAIANCLHRLKEDPANILYLIGNEKQAKKMAERYWRPWIKQVFGAPVADSPDQSMLFFNVNGVDLVSGPPTEKLLRDTQFTIIFEDESDTMPQKLDGGGQDIEVAERERVKNSRRSKIIRLCTPLFKFQPDKKFEQPRTRIHRMYLDGDQREYRCPCPSCRAVQPLNYDDLATEGDSTDLEVILTKTFWRCPCCGYEVREGSAKRTMVKEGDWFATVQGNGRIWSAWHTDMCNLIGKTTWGKIKHDITKAKGKPEEVGFRRAYLAEPEDLSCDSRQSATQESILRHCLEYRRGTCPVLPWKIALTVDVQKNCARFPWMISCIRRNGDIYVLDWGEEAAFVDLFRRDTSGRIGGLITTAIPLALEPGVVEAKWPDPAKRPRFVYPQRALIDSGYAAIGKKDEGNSIEESVYHFCLRTWHAPEKRLLFAPVKGRAGRQITVPTVDTAVPFNGATVPLHFYDDWMFKRRIYNIQLASDPARPSLSAKELPRIYFPHREDMLDHEESAPAGHGIISQLLSERLVEKIDKSGKVRQVWEAQGPNDLGDTLKWVSVLYAILCRQLNEAEEKASPAA